MPNTIITTYSPDDLQQIATDPDCQVVILKARYKDEVSKISSSTSKKTVRAMMDIVKRINENNSINTAHNNSKFLPMKTIATDLSDIFNTAASQYAQNNGIPKHQNNMTPVCYPRLKEPTPSWLRVGFLGAMVNFAGERIYVQGQQSSLEFLEPGDLLIAKCFDTIDHGNNKDDLCEISRWGTSTKNNTIGLSITMLKR